jgi:hypothetical protein
VVGERSEPGEGAYLSDFEHADTLPHPDPLPASGEKERAVPDERMRQI